jgi:hypothetical protein
MKYRNTTILSREDVGASGVKTVDLKLADIISRLKIRFGIIVASATPTETPAAGITKIQVVDGSDVLYELSGMQSQAMDFYDVGHIRHNNGSFVVTWELIANFYVNFGRRLWDPELALDPTKFVNPQLKITFDEDAACATPTSNALSVLADVFDEKVPSPRGFLSSKELYTYTPVSNAWEEIDMPTDHPYRKLLLEMRTADKWFGAMINEIKLSENNDKRIPLHLDNEELEYWLHDMYGQYIEQFAIDLNDTTGVDIYHTPTQGVVFSGNCYVSSDVLEAVPFSYVNKGKSGDNIGAQTIRVAGYFPHGCIAIPFGNQDDIDDWYDVKGKALKLKIKGGDSVGSSQTYRVCTQQMRSY